MTAVVERPVTSGVGTPTTHRIGAISGVVYAVLVLAGNGLYTGGSTQLGFVVEMVGYAALASFVAYVATTFRAGAAWPAMVALVGGTASLAVKLGGWAAARAAEQTEVTETAAALIAIDEAAWTIAWLPLGLFVVGLAAAALVTRRFHPAIAWTGIVIGSGCALAVAIPGDEPFAVPFLLSLLWIIIASIVLLRAEVRGEQGWSVEV
jgi:hypothetical protein